MDLDWYHHRAGMSEHVLLDAFEAEKNIALDRSRAVRDLRHFILAHVGSVEEIPGIAAIARANHGRKPMAVASGGSREIVRATLQAGLDRFDQLRGAKAQEMWFIFKPFATRRWPKRPNPKDGKMASPRSVTALDRA